MLHTALRQAMTKSELIQKLTEGNPHLYQSDLERIVTAIFNEIAAALARGFGTLVAKKRDARSGRNPRTGGSIDVMEKHIPLFRSGRALRRRLNEEM
jgi:integration host factor subunit beta